MKGIVAVLVVVGFAAAAAGLATVPKPERIEAIPTQVHLTHAVQQAAITRICKSVADQDYIPTATSYAAHIPPKGDVLADLEFGLRKPLAIADRMDDSCTRVMNSALKS